MKGHHFRVGRIFRAFTVASTSVRLAHMGVTGIPSRDKGKNLRISLARCVQRLMTIADKIDNAG